MRTIFLFNLFLLLACCQNETEFTASQEKLVEVELRQMLVDYFDAVRENGLAAELDYLDHSGDFFWVPPGYDSAIGYDSTRKAVINNAQILKKVNNRWDTLSINPLSSSFAVYTGRVFSVLTDTSGVESRYLLLETGIAVKRHDGWKLLCGHTSLVSDNQ